MRRNINNKRRLYESIMKDVSKIVKKHLNENSNNEIMPITLLKKAILKYKRAELLGDVRVRNLKNKIEYKIEIGINTSFEFYFTVIITEDINKDPYAEVECWDVYAYFTVEGLEEEICDNFVDIRIGQKLL